MLSDYDLHKISKVYKKELIAYLEIQGYPRVESLPA